jgi:hypothetical protein
VLWSTIENRAPPDLDWYADSLFWNSWKKARNYVQSRGGGGGGGGCVPLQFDGGEGLEEHDFNFFVMYFV